jgi:hypothetical protein
LWLVVAVVEEQITRQKVAVVVAVVVFALGM